MKILGDYHTHTVFSHGKGTVLENALAAKQKGLLQIGVADHGFGHILFGVDKAKMAKLRQEVDMATLQSGVKVLLGVEANFVSPKGEIDLDEEDIKQFDFVFVGHHRFVRSKFWDKLFFFLPNMLGIKTKKMQEKNTSAIINALEKYPIDALTHLKHGMNIDVLQVAKKCVETNTMIELNTTKMLFSKQEIDAMVQMGAKFLVSSDAHCPERVGCVSKIMQVIEEFQIPHTSIANLDKLPKFKRINL